MSCMGSNPFLAWLGLYATGKTWPKALCAPFDCEDYALGVLALHEFLKLGILVLETHYHSYTCMHLFLMKSYAVYLLSLHLSNQFK